MNSEKRLLLTSLINKSYIFSINVISFAKTLQKINKDNDFVDRLVFLSGNISDMLLDTKDKNNYDEIIANLQKSSTFAKNLLELLQSYKPEKVLLNEKIDIQIDNYQISEEINELILYFHRIKENNIIR